MGDEHGYWTDFLASVCSKRRSRAGKKQISAYYCRHSYNISNIDSSRAASLEKIRWDLVEIVWNARFDAIYLIVFSKHLYEAHLTLHSGYHYFY